MLHCGGWVLQGLSEDLSHGEIQELLGAYALGAVNDRERTIIEAHLQTCESCRVELDDYNRLAEALRRHASRMSPLASVEANGSERTSEDVARQRLVGRWRAPLAVAIVVVFFGGLFVQAQIRSDHLEARMARVELLERVQVATADPAAVVTTLHTPRDEPVLTVVSHKAGGDSYALDSALPRLATGQTYQLWRIDKGYVTAVVGLGSRPDTVAFSLPSGASALILTVEQRPVPPRPTLPAVATGQLFP